MMRHGVKGPLDVEWPSNVLTDAIESLVEWPVFDGEISETAVEHGT